MTTVSVRPRASAVLIALLCLGRPALAQSPEPGTSPPAVEVTLLREEVARLREEVTALRSAVADMKSAVAQQTPRPQAPAITPEAFEILKAQVEEHAQTKVESSSRLPVKLSGTILINGFVNSGNANWLENPNLVTAPPPGSDSTGSMSLTARQSRLGFAASGVTVGDWQASGTLIADFFGGVPNFQTGTVMGLSRLIYAFGRIENARTAVQAGQDHVLLAPRDPTSLAALAFPLLFRSGNLYQRAPQARVEQKVGRAWTLAAGLVAPLAGDAGGPYEFAPAAGAGERSRRPAFEARAGVSRGDADSDRRVAAGISTHYGWRRTAAALTRSWAVAIDLDAQAGRFGVAGEVYTADNAEPFGSALSQAGRASGGWAEGRVALATRARVAAGFGIDRPKNAFGLLLRTENRSTFGNVIFDLTPELAISAEHRWLRTRYGPLLPARATHHLNAVLAFRF